MTANGSLSSVQMVEIDADQAGQRLDNFLLTRLKGLPRSRLYRLLRKGEVRVNKGRVKPEYRLCAGDQVRIPPVRLPEAAPVPHAGQSLIRLLERAILLETPELLVINKPAGLAVHGGSGVSLGLIEALRQTRPDDRYLELVHRLDRETSGCVMVARKRSMLRHLQGALRRRDGVRKVYWALVAGHWPETVQQVEAPLLKSEVGEGERIVRVHPEGKPSLTRFRPLARYRDCTLIEARPITGRTHQIRVHAQYQGHALVGDDKYGDDAFNEQMRQRGFKRMFLHAAELSFYLPDASEPTVVKAPLGDDLAAPLGRLVPIED